MGSKPKNPGPTEQERALSKDAARRWNDYVERYIPVENEFMRRNEATPQKMMAARGVANADAGLVAHGLQGQMNTALASQGAAPGSGRAMGAATDLNSAWAEASGLGQGAMQQGVIDQSLAGKQKLATFGRGLDSNVQLGMGQAAETAHRANMSAFENKVNKSNFMTHSLATGAGLGLMAGNSYFGNKPVSNWDESSFFKLSEQTPGRYWQ
jgi:hypothetical protein